ncbi:MAG: STAS domain-containing protein [Burkholderiales bacterium]|nr:STAS domain-containing protein [Pseudomonadota bacterium]
MKRTAGDAHAEIVRNGVCIGITGAITIDNVARLIEIGRAQLGPEVREVDLSGLSEVDSSAIGLLLEWQRVAQAQHRVHLRFKNLPENLRSLASLYDVLELIPET